MNNPKTPTDNLYRVLRGGSWRSTSATCVRASYRDYCTPTVRSYYFGFRCAQRGVRMPR